jgi:hypothetical protein
MFSKILVWVPVLFLLSGGQLRAQTPDTAYSWILFAGAGYTRNVSTFDFKPAGLLQNGFTGTVRVMWKPEHLLSVGIETGYQYVYGAEVESYTSPDFGTTDAQTSLYAVPILLVLSMPVIDRFEVWVGAGAGLLTSHVEFFGDVTDASSFTPMGFGAVSYLYPIGENLRLGGEARYIYMERFHDQNFSIQAVLSWTFATY